MERQAKDGTIYQKVGEDQWTPVTRTAKDGTVYKKVGQDSWSPLESEAQKAPSASKSVVGVRNFLQGGTMGLSDEFAGVVEAAGRAAGLQGAGGPLKNVTIAEGGPTLDLETLKQAYESGRNAEREALKKDMKESPKLATVANVVGAVASPVNKLTGGMSVAKSGALIGGLTGLGTSESEDLQGLAKDTLVGAGAGAILGKTVDGVVSVTSPLAQKAATKVSQKARDLAEKFSARAIGAERGTINKFGQKRVQEAGAQALDEGILSPLASTEEKVARNKAINTRAMNERADAYNKIDQANASTFNPLEVATKTEKKVVGEANRAYDDTKELVQTLEPHLQNILSRGEGNISLKEAQTLVESLGKKAKFDTSRSSQANQVAKEVYNSVRESINQAAAEGADKIGVDGLRQVIEGANKKYATGQVSGALLKNKVAREGGNQIIGLTDAITGAGSLGYGATTGDWETAGGIFLAKKGLQKYGAQNTALALNRISKALAKSPQIAEIAQKSPAIIQTLVARLENPSSLPKAADKNSPERELKGKEKWAADGISKLLEHDKTGAFLDEKFMENILSTPQGKDLLIQASDLKPGSKSMDNIMNKIKSRVARGGD